MKRLITIAGPAAVIVLLLALWELACRQFSVPSYFLPAPSAILVAGVKAGPELASATVHTLIMALSALLLVSLLGTGLAIVLALSRVLERAIKPVAIGLQVTPIIAIAPLAVIWAGLDHPGRAIVALAAVVAFFPIFSGALTGLKSAEPDLERLFDLYGAGRLQRLLRLQLPSAVPYLLEGHKVAAGQALIGAVVAEYVARTGSSQGLAWIVLEAGHDLQTPKLFAALFVLAFMGGALFAALQLIERAALAWWRGR